MWDESICSTLSLTFNLQSWSAFYEMVNRNIQANCTEFQSTVTLKLLEFMGTFSVYLVICLWFDHFEKGGRRREASGSGRSKWTRLVSACLWSVNFMQSEEYSESWWAKCRTHPETKSWNSWEVEESSTHIIYHWPCLNAFSGVQWKCRQHKLPWFISFFWLFFLSW